MKEKWGWTDPRNTQEFEDCDICANDIFRTSWTDTGVERRAFEAPPAMGPAGSEASPAAADGNNTEQLVQSITDRVMQQLAQSS